MKPVTAFRMLVILVLLPSVALCQSIKDGIDGFRMWQIFTKDSITQEDLEAAQSLGEKSPLLQHFLLVNLAKLHIQKGELGQADSITTKGIEIFSKEDTLAIEVGDYSGIKGGILLRQGDHEEAVRQMARALRIYEHHDATQRAAAMKIDLSNGFIARGAYEQAYQYSSEAVAAFQDSQDSLIRPLVLGLAAICASKLGKWDETKQYAEEALKISEIKNNEAGIANAKYALSDLASHNKEYERSVSYNIESLRLAIKIKENTLILANKVSLLQNYLALKQYDKALEQSDAAFALANKSQNKDILYSLYKNTAEAHRALGNERLAFEQMQAAEKLYKNKVNRSNQEIINDLLIKYETEKKSNQILAQEKEIAQKQTWIAVLGALALVAILIGLSIRRNARQKRKLLEQKMKIEVAEAHAEGEEQERNRIAGELHDGVASNLVALKFMLPKDKPQAINLLDNTHQEVRTIAHRLAPIDFQRTSLVEEMASFCQICQSEQTEVEFISQVEKIHLPSASQQVLYRITQELIQNALKHAEANYISVQFLQNNQTYKLSVEDYGKGFDTSIIEEQQGLSSLKRRVASIQGTIDIDSHPQRGTSIFVEV